MRLIIGNIGEYLAEKFPDVGLWPGTANLRARARTIGAEMHAGFASLRAAMPIWNLPSMLDWRSAAVAETEFIAEDEPYR